MFYQTWEDEEDETPQYRPTIQIDEAENLDKENENAILEEDENNVSNQVNLLKSSNKSNKKDLDRQGEKITINKNEQANLEINNGNRNLDENIFKENEGNIVFTVISFQLLFNLNFCFIADDFIIFTVTFCLSFYIFNIS